MVDYLVGRLSSRGGPRIQNQIGGGGKWTWIDLDHKSGSFIARGVVRGEEVLTEKGFWELEDQKIT